MFHYICPSINNTMKSLIFSILVLFTVTLTAQDKKQVIIKKSETITKSVDENGKVTTKTETSVSQSGDSASKEDLEKDFLNNGKDGEFITVDKQINNGKETTTYTLTTKKKGEVNVMKWDGQGKVPEAFKGKMDNIDMNADDKNTTITIDTKGDKPKEKKVIIVKKMNGEDKEEDINVVLKQAGIDLKDMPDTKDGKHIKIITVDKDNANETKVIEWNGEGEIPAELKDKISNININKNGDETMITIDAKDDNSSADRIIKKEVITSRNGNSSKVKLGVMLDDTRHGVKVDEVFKDSAADKAGIQKGDVILKMDDEYIFSSDVVMEKMQAQKSGNKLNLVVLRNGKEKKMNVNL